MRNENKGGRDWRPAESRSSDNDITQPIRIICSRDLHPGKPRDPRARWFKQQEENTARRTPDWTQIGGKAGNVIAGRGGTR